MKGWIICMGNKKHSIFYLIIIVLLLYTNAIVFTDTSLPSFSDTQSAISILSHTKNLVSSSSWDEAILQAKMGIAYDKTIADFYYIQALAFLKKNSKKFYIIDFLKEALFSNKIWHEYNPSDARLMLADMYSQTQQSEKAIALLDEYTEIQGKNSLLVRLRSLYNLQKNTQAEQLFKQAFELYPNDSDFLRLFFEQNAKNTDKQYLDFLINTVYKGIPRKDNILLYALPFVSSDETREVFLKAWRVQESTHPLYSVYGYTYGFLDAQTAFDSLKPFLSTSIPYQYLAEFVQSLTDISLQQKIKDFFSTYSGTITFDFNHDFFPDVFCTYQNGQIFKINFDNNQDGIFDWQIDCADELPQRIIFPKNHYEAEYSSYPFVEKLTFKNNDDFTEYHFIAKKIQLDVLDFIPFGSFLENTIYIPRLKSQDNFFKNTKQFFNASRVIYKHIDEEKNAIVRLELFNGKVQNAHFLRNNQPYAFALFMDGHISFRNVDKNQNGIFEIREFYEPGKGFTPNFGFSEITNQTHLSSVEVDSDEDGIKDFHIEYTQDGNKITYSGIQSDGNWDIRYEENIHGDMVSIGFVNPFDNTVKTLRFKDSRLQKVDDFDVIFDDVENFIWIDKKPQSVNTQKLIAEFESTQQKSAQMVHSFISEPIAHDNQSQGSRTTKNLRIFIVKNGKMYYGYGVYE